MAQYADILNAMRLFVVSDEVVPSVDRVLFWASDEDPPNLVGDRDLVVRTQGISVPQEIVQGAGRLSRIYRNVEITLRIRDARDAKNSDEIWLTDADRGLLAFEDKLLNSLQMFDPANADGSNMLAEPMRLVNSSKPIRRTPKNAPKGWGESSQMWQTAYEPALDKTRQ